MLLRPDESQTFEVWWGAAAAQCSWTEDLSAVPPGFLCSVSVAPLSSFGFLVLKHPSIGPVTFINTCVAATIADPRFTG